MLLHDGHPAINKKRQKRSRSDGRNYQKRYRRIAKSVTKNDKKKLKTTNTND